MILKALKDYAEAEGLVDAMEVKRRPLHFQLVVEPDGSICEASPWRVLTDLVHDDKKNKTTEEVGRPTLLPEFPGVNAGGKAQFLADSCDKVLGLNGKTGEPIPDDGQNAAKAFRHYWQRVADAYEATKLAELKSLLDFRDRYLATEDSRRSLAIVGMHPFGRDAKPTFCIADGRKYEPLDKRTIIFQVGSTAGPLFSEGSPLHDYWKATFASERFVAASNAKLGVCLVTGAENQPIAEVHRTLIKGVPGLPPIGGYLVSFDRSTPSLASYGLEGGWNAPVSEQAAAAYALGLNDILANVKLRRRFGDAVLCSWIKGEFELSSQINSILDNPAEGDVASFFRAFDQGQYSEALKEKHFHSVTLAANGGRVVVRRWLDEPLGAVVKSLRRWFDDLAIEAVAVPKKAAPSKGKVKAEPGAAKDAERPAVHPLSIYALASTTARVASEVQSTVYDALYLAAFEGAGPSALLAPILQRLKIEAAQSGGAIRFHTSRFALLKLILNRSKGPEDETPMTIERQLCETHDAAYNCGRLLALLDDLQYAAQGDVGADIVSRFYGNASTFPRNVLPRLLVLQKHHYAKALKNPKRMRWGKALGRKINDVIALFPKGAGDCPEFPGILSHRDQGRFAIGFHQQKAKNDRDLVEILARKSVESAPTDAEIADEFLSEPLPE